MSTTPDKPPPIAAHDGRPRWRRWVPAVSTAAVVLLVLLAWRRRDGVAWDSFPDDVAPAPPAPPRVLTPTERASIVRHDAFVACAAKQWDVCAAELDWAQGLDPAGESAKRVVAARAAIAAATAADGGAAPRPK